MRLLDVLSPSADSDHPDSDDGVSRRDAIDRLRTLGLGAAALSLPFALVGRPRVARAQSMGDAVEVLNYALTLEYLEAAYYRQGLDATLASGDALLTGDARTIYGQIAAHEDAHVAVLTDTIDQLGGTPVEFADADFDFTAGGAFDPFGDYATFLLLSQAFEDTGVRAYKGQAAALTGNELLTPALQIHSVEARHAAEVRRLRAAQGASLKPWITQAESGSAPAAVYAGEDTITQAGIDPTTLGDYTADEVTEAYDEPLTMDAVAGPNGIAAPFLA